VKKWKVKSEEVSKKYFPLTSPLLTFHFSTFTREAMLAIRMRRVGSKKKPYFRVVVTEARAARESDFVENVGTYHPRSKPARVEINKERVQHWLKMGARPSDSVRTLLAKHMTRDLGASAATEGATATVTQAE
jgi:small subunit ribosomal protein S16